MKKGVQTEVMNKIYQGKVEMKPKWWFQIKEVGLQGLWSLVLLAGSLLLTVGVYKVEQENPVELLEFGELGVEVLIQDFPYFMLLGVVIFLIGGVLLYSQIGENYKKTTEKIVAIMGGLLLLLTLLMVSGRIFVGLEGLF